MAWEDEMGGILNNLFMYYKGRGPNEAQVDHWVRQLAPFSLAQIKQAVEDAVNSGRGMPNIDDIRAKIRSKTGTTMESSLSPEVELTDDERAFNLSMFGQMMRLINKEIDEVQFVTNARHLERKFGIGPLDWSNIAPDVDDQRTLL